MPEDEKSGPAVYIALLHYPVLDKDGRVINTAVTNMDLHDLSRLARTYNLRAYFVIQGLALQKALVNKMMGYWRSGPGGEYNHTRQQAFERTRLRDSLDDAVEEIERETGTRPSVIVTTAKTMAGAVKYPAMSAKIAEGGSWLIVFGTGWGIEPGFIADKADYVLTPVEPGSDYNHLSVRTAAAIILDRLFGERD